MASTAVASPQLGALPIRRTNLVSPITWPTTVAASGRCRSQRQSARQAIRPHAVAAAQHAVELVLTAFVSPVCFSEACQEATDRAFLIALSVPLLVAVVAAAVALQPPPAELTASGRVFEDSTTGIRFEAPEGVSPERDKNGELAYRPISYTPWPVDESYVGERVRIAVGPVAARQLRTFVFARALPVPSDILTVTLPRPLGVVLEYDERFKRATVVDLIEGTNADQRRKRASLNSDLAKDAVLPGDTLRAVTATNFVYPTRALFGAVPPERHIVVYGADKEKWSAICGALKKGEFKDGDVTLVLERRRPRPAKESVVTSMDIFAP